MRFRIECTFKMTSWSHKFHLPASSSVVGDIVIVIQRFHLGCQPFYSMRSCVQNHSNIGQCFTLVKAAGLHRWMLANAHKPLMHEAFSQIHQLALKRASEYVTLDLQDE